MQIKQPSGHGLRKAAAWLRHLFRPIPRNPEHERYDKLIVQYLELWGRGLENHELVAQDLFGFDEDDIVWINQVLCSAAIGTIHNYANSDDPWYQAAYRLVHSSRRRFLRPLRKSLLAR